MIILRQYSPALRAGISLLLTNEEHLFTESPLHSPPCMVLILMFPFYGLMKLRLKMLKGCYQSHTVAKAGFESRSSDFIQECPTWFPEAFSYQDKKKDLLLGYFLFLQKNVENEVKGHCIYHTTPNHERNDSSPLLLNT